MSFPRGKYTKLARVPRKPKSMAMGIVGPAMRRLLKGETRESFWKLRRMMGMAMIWAEMVRRTLSRMARRLGSQRKYCLMRGEM